MNAGLRIFTAPEQVDGDNLDDVIKIMGVAIVMSMNRRLFCTKSGFLSIGPKILEPVEVDLTRSGCLRVHTSQVAAYVDDVWVFDRARSPVVLRLEQGRRYSFLSEALLCRSDGLLSEMIFGRMIDLVRTNQANFVILLLCSTIPYLIWAKDFDLEFNDGCILTFAIAQAN